MDSRLELIEYEPKALTEGELTREDIQGIWSLYRESIELAPPSPSNEWRWTVTSRGQVGYLPLPSGKLIAIAPRVPIESVFRMWAVAYPGPPKWRLGEVNVRTLEDLYDWIANELASGVLKRLARGLYVQYVDRVEDLVTPRGRIDVRRAVERHWNVALRCIYQDLTCDVTDNQLLADALYAAARSASLSTARASVRNAYLGLSRRSVSQAGHAARECLGRMYGRLNIDYEWLHWLCHFILAGAGPTHAGGAAPIQGFQIWMPGLFETFVAKWLKGQMASQRIDTQIPRDVGQGLEFRPDVVLRDRSGQATAVLDTKYKLDATPSEADVAQIVAYATELGCTDAVLIYPMVLTSPIKVQIGPVRVRSLSFVLEGDLDQAGAALLAELNLAAA